MDFSTMTCQLMIDDILARTARTPGSPLHLCSKRCADGRCCSMYAVRDIRVPQAVQLCAAYLISMLIRLSICSLGSSPQPCLLTMSSFCCGCVMRGAYAPDTYVACRTRQRSHGRQENSWPSQLSLMMQAAAA